jgi:hypothetical protein
MTIEEIMGEKVALLRAQLAALPDSTASDPAQKTADEIRSLLVLEQAGRGANPRSTFDSMAR